MASKRNVYLRKKTLQEALDLLFENFPGIGNTKPETISVTEAVGRVLAEPVYAKMSAPNFHASAMDGIAVASEATFGTSETKPRLLKVGTDAIYVNTGHPLPENTDAVIIIEDVVEKDNGYCEIHSPAFPWQNIRKMGEDIVATELLFPTNHTITPYCIGALLSAGIKDVVVRKKPKIMIIPTGSELIDWERVEGCDLRPGQVIESNSFLLGKMAEACGADFSRHELMPDDMEGIKNSIAQSINEGFDIILTVGGSSAGTEDYTLRVISELGSVFVHGITIMPGKPTIIGKVKDTPVFGMPGYPVSAIIAFEQVVKPLILSMQGKIQTRRETTLAEPIRKIPSKLGVEEFIRVKLGLVGDRLVASQLPRGAGSITTITEAHGIIRVPNHVEGLQAGVPVETELLCPMETVKNTIVAVGSHDNSLDVIADILKTRDNRISLSSSHVGSMGGLMAIRQGTCHVAGTHLLDPDDGTYNQSYIKKYLPETPVRLIRLVTREQGLIIPKGNPKKISGIEDLVRDDVEFLNRQPGSGTRILLDYQLKKLDMDPAEIKGYGQDEFTHMSVAVGVKSGVADTGLGIFAASKALDMDFIPIITEEYDLVIPEKYFSTDSVATLLTIITGNEFKTRVNALGGYSTEKTGDQIMVHP